MIEELVARNMTKTIEFLWRIGLCKGDEFMTIQTNSRLQIAYVEQRSGRHMRAWTILACEAATRNCNNMVFCKCCNIIRIFVRNYSLLQHFRETNRKFVAIIEPEDGFISEEYWIKEKDCIWDVYCDFLTSIATRNINKLKSVIKTIPLLWEAYLELSEIDTTNSIITGPLSIYYIMLLKVKQDINLLDNENKDKTIDITNNNTINSITVDIFTCNNKNLLAAFLHMCEDDIKANSIFHQIFFEDNYSNEYPRSFEYVEIYAQMLQDTELEILMQLVENECPGTPECYAVRGIYLGTRGELLPAIAALKKSLRLRWDDNINCLLGNAYAQAKKRAEALNCFRCVIDRRPINFRLARAVAHGLYILGEQELAIRQARRVLALNEDGPTYKLLGQLYLNLNDDGLALQALHHAVQFGTNDALLYIAEAYRKMNKPEYVIEAYEKYIKLGNSDISNKEAVLKYLFDYYQEIGDIEKGLFYKRMM